MAETIKRTYKVLNVEDIKVDMSYQRKLRNTHKIIAEKFDPNKLGTIVVSNRGTEEEPDYYVIDGQHRLEAFKLLELESIPALVMSGLTVAQEKDIFATQDQNKVKITGYDIYNAQKLTPGTYDNRLYKISKKTGVECLDHLTRVKQPGPRAFTAYKVALRLHGDKPVEKAFTLFRDSKHREDPALYVRYLFDALITLFIDNNLTYRQIFRAVESFDPLGELYNLANKDNMYAYINAPLIANTIRARIEEQKTAD